MIKGLLTTLSRFRQQLMTVLLITVSSMGLYAQADLESRLMAEGFAIAQDRQEAPDITLENLDGIETSLSSYKGSVVFLNFWATWCAPCRIEMPSMERLFQQLDGDRFVLLAVNLREQHDTVLEFADELDLTFPILLDSQGITGAVYGISGIPTTYLIDKEGQLVARFVGSREWDTPEIADIIRQLVGE